MRSLGERAPRVLVVGDLLYDLLSEVREVSFGTDTFAPIHVAAGGSGANAASWLARLGVETHFVGRVGDDVFGGFLNGELERAGVIPHLARDRDLPTGKVFVLVDGSGERTMITDRGASEVLQPDNLPTQFFESGTHLHLSGYTFSKGTRRETAFEALRLARQSSMTVSVDPSSVPLLKNIGPDRFLEWTAGAELCLPNLEEGALLAGTREPKAILAALREHYRGVVLKLGARGAVYAGEDADTIWLPSAETRAVDTTGAGDALCAGFLSAWVAGSTSAEALRRGVGVAGRVVGRIGSRPE